MASKKKAAAAPKTPVKDRMMPRPSESGLVRSREQGPRPAPRPAPRHAPAQDRGLARPESFRRRPEPVDRRALSGRTDLHTWTIFGLDSHGRQIEQSEPFRGTQDEARTRMLEELEEWMRQSHLVMGAHAERGARRS
jgi:hypothetical protein